MSRFNPDSVLKDFVNRVELIGINYMLTGSMAMIVYAVPRLTMDIDIVIELDSLQQNEFIKTFEPDYYIPHAALKRAVAQKKMFNIIHQTSAFKIACVVRKDDEYQKIAFDNRRLISYKGSNVWVIWKDDLIISKLRWAKDTGSELQLRDVRNLMKEGYNVEYLKSWTRRLAVEDLFLECQKELGE